MDQAGWKRHLPENFWWGEKVSNVALQIHTYHVVYAQTDRRGHHKRV